MTPRRVLVVDDDPDLRFLLRIALDRPGETEVIAEAVDGLDAVVVAGQYQPDVIVLDEMMPGRAGTEAITSLRSAAPGVRIVVYTAGAVDTVTHRSARAPADIYLRKDSGMRALVTAVLG